VQTYTLACVNADLVHQFDHVFWAGDLNYRVAMSRFGGPQWKNASHEAKWAEVSYRRLPTDQ
jgi:hypothetical protein